MLIGYGRALQEMATVHGIHNVFDDNGYKDLILLTLFGLTKLGREGDDAVDQFGRRFETKTVARVSSKGVRKRSLSITTEHTMTIANIERYRASFLWIVAVFDQAAPEAIWEISPLDLEPFFSKWEALLRAQDSTGRLVRDHLNNPKIPLAFVREHGVQVWPRRDATPNLVSNRPLRHLFGRKKGDSVALYPDRLTLHDPIVDTSGVIGSVKESKDRCGNVGLVEFTT